MNYLSHTIAKVGKERNGDHLAFLYLEEESILVAMVADGVSQQPTDWLASELACKGFMEQFQKIKHTPLKERIEASVEHTNEALIATGTKMGSTLSVVIYDYIQNQFHWSSIGDSRIYRIGPEGLECLTEDDVITQNRLVSSQRKTFGEQEAVLSQAIGQLDISISVETSKLKEDELIIIASDGFYNARPASFEKRMLDFYNQEDRALAFDKLVDQFAMLRGDDLSVIALWPAS